MQHAPGESEESTRTSTMHIAIESVTSTASECPQVSAAQLTADATVALVEDSVMQQLMLDQLVCALCWPVSLCC